MADSTTRIVITGDSSSAVKAVERLNAVPDIVEIVSTDTVPPPLGWPQLQVRSVAELFAEAIARIHASRSISKLFDDIDPTHEPPQPRLPFDDIAPTLPTL